MPSKHARFGAVAQLARFLLLATYFNMSCVAIHVGQILLSPLWLVNKAWFYRYMRFSKEQFGILIATITQFFMPTTVRVSGDASVRGLLEQTRDGRLETHLPERLVLIANHQIYTEWLYLWWIAYTSNMHGAIYIMLKDSLRKIPVIGTAMMYYGFIFMSRKFSIDKPRIDHRLKKLQEYWPAKLWHTGSGQVEKKQSPMWFIIFPEGTNLSANTKRKSHEYAGKVLGTKSPMYKNPLKHTVIPRSTGLRYTLQQLGTSVRWVYDITIAYEGVGPGQFAQDLFTLRSTFLQGRPPKSVNMYLRRIHIDMIPVCNSDLFEEWLHGQWREKDFLIAYYQRHGFFPADTDTSSPPGPVGVGHIETEVKLRSAWEIGQLFIVLLIFAAVAYVLALFYNLMRFGHIAGQG